MRPVLHSYAFRDYPLAHAFRVAAADGWPALELSSWHYGVEFGGDVRACIAAAVALGKRHGVNIYCAGYWAVFTEPGAADRERWVSSTRRLIDECAAHGITMINGVGGWLVQPGDRWDEDWRRNGSAMASAEDLARVADCYRSVAAHAAEQGVRVVIEVHPNTVHDTVAATARLLELAEHENLLVTVDPANAAVLSVADRDPAVLGPIADRVRYFHLKNCLLREGVGDFTVDAAAGVVDNYRWLARLAELPQVDAVAVEYCGEGDPHPRLAAGRRYLADTLRLIRA